MEFTLYYRGPLKSNARPKDKHTIRCVLHEQLSVLWQQEPLGHFLQPKHTPPAITVAGFAFQPLVRKQWHMIADLHIVMLRPEAPGSLITQGGDIDNRLKTLFDALRIPKTATELPQGAIPSPTQTPFFGLLEDDNLITGIQVQTEQFLEPGAGKNEVVLLIRVRTKKTNATWENLGL